MFKHLSSNPLHLNNHPEHTSLISMDTAVLTVRGRGDRGVLGGGRRVQAETCHMHPLPGTSHGGQSKRSAKKTTLSVFCRGRGGVR